MDLKELEEVRQYKESFEKVFKCKDGEVVLKVLSDKCFSDIGSYKNDTNKIIFDEGKRNVLLQILKLSSIDIVDFLKQYEILKCKTFVKNHGGEH